jgi:hypothetical protein
LSKESRRKAQEQELEAMTIDPRLHRIGGAVVSAGVHATISGAHLYGFPSPDSDFDLRGAHVLPLDAVVGLDVRDETVQDSRVIEGLEMDIVSHDVRKFFGLLLKKNGYVLEQLFSPLVVHTTPEHEELKNLLRAHHEAPRGPLLRLRGDAVEAVPQRIATSGEAVALRLSRAAHRHSLDAHW